jgi:hypothetical protein
VAVGSRAPVLQRKLVEALEAKLDADVDLQDFAVSGFPIVRISGDGLRLRLKHQREEAPLIDVRHFAVTGGVTGFFYKPRRFQSVTLEGLRITIPPRSDNDREAGNEAAGTTTGPIIINHLSSKDAELRIMPKNPAKDPRVFAIHDLHLDSVGFDRAMPFHAILTNPIPTGLIDATGTFGPWRAADPGATSVSGRYEFKNVDLGTIKGIGGTLTSTGQFTGQLDRIDVSGTTTTPNFSVDVGGAPVPLDTTFHAIVDGTDGDTYLQPVQAKFLQTSMTATGGVYGQKGVKGRTVKLDVHMTSGRVEDVLRLAVNATTPLLVGAMTLETRLLLPPGDAKVPDRLQLDGRFAIARARFTDRDVQEKLVTLSRHAQGKAEDEPLEKKVLTDLNGHFVMRNGVIQFDKLTFGVPGALVTLAGDFNLRSERLNFGGTFRMDATISKAVGGGIKGILLKPFDPLFRKKGAGAVIPIRITGTRAKPEVGVDWGKAFTSK